MTLSGLIGFAHDLGKGTTFFQEYLNKRRPSSFITSHSTSSSLFAFNSAKAQLGEDLAFLALMLVQGHHGRLPTPSEAAGRIITHDKDLKEQLSALLPEVEESLSSLGKASFRDCEQLVGTPKQIYQLKNKIEPLLDDSLRPYFLANLTFSCLVDADRTSASGLEIPPRLPIDDVKISRFVQSLSEQTSQRLGKKSKIAGLRETMRRKVLSKATLERRIYALSAPTGSGKTLTGLLFACRLRNMIFQEQGRLARIIYVSPFLSIIDQNAEVISESLGASAHSQTNLVLSHHHLARLSYQEPDRETYSTSHSQLLIEGWNAEIIVTTFVQFLETVIGARASSLRKLHNLVGAIVILDEVQSINHEYWKLVHDCLRFLSDELDTRVILMTATQPLIFGKDEVKELFDKSLRFPERVGFKVRLTPTSLDDFIVSVQEIIDAEPKKNILVILNTIESAQRVFERLTAAAGTKYFLSAGIVPFERKQRIGAISGRLRFGQRTILVSTQVVEAGVDFDFDIVIRDLAPVDSIIQAAGRCNRNGTKKVKDSPVYVFKIRADDGSFLANRIYGNFLIETSQKVLSQRKKVPAEMARSYYKMVSEGSPGFESGRFLTAMKRLDYGEIDNFTAIEEAPTVSVFVMINEEAEALWSDYLLAESADSRQLSRFLREKRDRFYSYVINTYDTNKALIGLPMEGNFFVVNRQELSHRYGVVGLQTHVS